METEHPAQSPDGISMAEAAEILGASVGSVSRWASSGYLPALVVGSRGREPYVFERAVVQSLADRRAEAHRVLDWKSGAVA